MRQNSCKQAAVFLNLLTCLSMSSTSGLTQLPPGPSLTPHLIDFRSLHDAHRVCISYPTFGTSKYIDITFQDLDRAVNNAAWTFSKEIGARRSSSEPTKVVGILARRYVVCDCITITDLIVFKRCGVLDLYLCPPKVRHCTTSDFSA